jgi:hypothetical protein
LSFSGGGKHHLTRQEFIDQSLSIGEPQELSPKFLGAVYDSVVFNNLRTTEQLPITMGPREFEVEFAHAGPFGIRLVYDDKNRECVLSGFNSFGVSLAF